jgi:hypothetical protein
VRAASFRKLSELTDAELLEEFDDLVVHATRGDRYALTVLSVGLGPVILDEARIVLGPGREEHANGIVAELFIGMLRGELIFAPGAVHAGPWLGAQLHFLAARRLLSGSSQ